MKCLAKRNVMPLVLLLAAACSDASDRIAVGTLERDRIELVSEAFEPITEILVREGDALAAGDIVLRLDDRRARLLLAAAGAERDVAAAVAAELETGPRGERIASARATLDGAEEAVVETLRARERADALLADKIISQARRDTASLQYAQARATRDAARAQLEELEEGTRSERLDQARASLARAEIGVRQAELHLERHDVRAPVAGRVEALPWEIGERPQAGRSVAVMLASGAPWARVYVPGNLRATIQPGDVAFIEVAGLDKIYEGRLRYVASDAIFTPFFALTEHDRGKLTYLAEIDLTEPGAADLPTGLPVEVRFGRGAGE
jgi:HlyD family secretion protein